jgi:hypothetical protein
MADSTLGGIIEFFVDLGVYDVVLPFLLVFTIVFAILEKTRVLGTDMIDKHHYSKKNLNSMVAFCVAFFVILSQTLVSAISEALANIVVLLLVSVCFLLLIGSFAKETKEPVFLEGWWAKIFMVIMFIGVVFIFLHAIPTGDGSNWLEAAFAFVGSNWDEEWGAAIIFVLAMAGFMAWVTQPSGGGKKKDEAKSSSSGGDHGHP